MMVMMTIVMMIMIMIMRVMMTNMTIIMKIMMMIANLIGVLKFGSFCRADWQKQKVNSKDWYQDQDLVLYLFKFLYSGRFNTPKNGIRIKTL